jgi:iron complex transport system substrate-binding protein
VTPFSDDRVNRRIERSRAPWWVGILLLLIGVMMSPAVLASLTVRDDAGEVITLQAHAHRIISLAPNVTELLYAAGAGSDIVGASAYSDYPEAAKGIPRVGSGSGLDMEAIVALHPDLVVAWQTGNPPWQIEKLRKLGLTVFMTEPRRLGDVAALLERFGKLAGTQAVAGKAARAFRLHEARLRARFSTRPAVSVFYQILDNTLMTVNGSHIISDIIRLCGGKNVFAGMPGLTPRVDMESVLQKNPEVILAGGYEPLWAEWRDRWRDWPTLSAVEHGNLFLIPADWISRQTPRILLGAEQVCASIEQARAERKASSGY